MNENPNPMYVKALAILLLLSGLIGGLWKLYDAGGDAREAEVRLEYSERESLRDRETLRLQQLLSEQKRVAEESIKAERKTWEKRINALKHMRTDCISDDVLIILRDAGVYTGPIPCK
jgi:hypothetical protein